MKISLRALTIGGSVLAVVFLTGTAAAVSAQTTTAAHPITAASRCGSIPSPSSAPNFREDTFLPVSAEFGGPGSAGSGCTAGTSPRRCTGTTCPPGPRASRSRSPTWTPRWRTASTTGSSTTSPSGHHPPGARQQPVQRGNQRLRHRRVRRSVPPPGRPGSSLRLHRVRPVGRAHSRNAPHVRQAHRRDLPDVVGATSTIGKFRLPLGGSLLHRSGPPGEAQERMARPPLTRRRAEARRTLAGAAIPPPLPSPAVSCRRRRPAAIRSCPAHTPHRRTGRRRCG